jgi:hypothetical protein
MSRNKNPHTPNLWWDFIWHNDKISHIAVQCQSDKYPKTLTTIPQTDKSGRKQAENIIDDLEAGRKTFKEVINS